MLVNKTSSAPYMTIILVLVNKTSSAAYMTIIPVLVNKTSSASSDLSTPLSQVFLLFPNIPTSHTLPGISSLPQYPSLLHPSRYFLFSSISQPLTLSQVFPHVSTCILVTTIFSLTFKHVTKYRNFVAFRTMPITPPRL